MNKNMFWYKEKEILNGQIKIKNYAMKKLNCLEFEVPVLNACKNYHLNPGTLVLVIRMCPGNEYPGIKFWQSRVPTPDSFSRGILKVCILGRVIARFWKPKIMISWSTITSPVQTRSWIIVHTQILIHVITFFYQNTYNPQIGLIFDNN